MAESKKYEVTVAATGDLSSPTSPILSRNQYVFAYTITITNTGTVAAQLLSAATGSSPTPTTRCRK